MTIALLIPGYEPEDILPLLVRDLEECMKDMDAGIFVVDDGSGRIYDRVFESAKAYGAEVISYETNRGKGYAIRTGIRYICGLEKHYDYIITADADGQHRPEDIIKVAEAALSCLKKDQNEGTSRGSLPLIVGTRDFGAGQVPFRSRFGNRFSSLYFKFVTGVTLKDTQTGLRAIPAPLYDLALKTPGDRYDYEMNFLIAAADFIISVPVGTVYAEGNKSSHFRPFQDSVRIYKTPLKYISSSLISAGADLTLFAVLTGVFGTLSLGIALATVLARIASGILNFTLNRVWAFSQLGAKKRSAGRQAARYLLLFFTQMILSSTIVTMLSLLPIPVIAVKIIADSGLGLLSYYVQHTWVFGDGAGKGTRKKTAKRDQASSERRFACTKKDGQVQADSGSFTGFFLRLSHRMFFWIPS